MVQKMTEGNRQTCACARRRAQVGQDKKSNIYLKFTKRHGSTKFLINLNLKLRKRECHTQKRTDHDVWTNKLKITLIIKTLALHQAAQHSPSQASIHIYAAGNEIKMRLFVNSTLREGHR